MADVVVFADPDGTHYVACFGEDREWFRWPAERHGWRSRTRCSEGAVEQCEELPPTLARLALVLSGVPSASPFQGGNIAPFGHDVGAS